jgi:3-oxoacyl-[acyl-carrier-protein] synthase II
MLILEEMENALNRGAEVYAEIIDYGANSDAYSIVQMHQSADQIRKLLNKVVGDCKVDYLNTHGTATLLNDEVEANIIQSFFGDKEKQPIFNSTKGNLGHSIGAAGASEIAVSALSVKNNIVHANIAEDLIEGLNIAEETTRTEINYALSTSYGFGGHNSVILLKKFVP